MTAKIPTPVIYKGSTPYVWGSAAYDGSKNANVYQLVSWGDSAPPPLRLTAIERCAVEWYGGVCEFGDGAVASIFGNAYKRKSDGAWASLVAGDAAWHPSPIAWAADPSLVMYEVGNRGTPTKITYGSGNGAHVASASGQLALGSGAGYADRLTALEIQAIRKGGWANVSGKHGVFVIDLIDLKFRKVGGIWYNANHLDTPLGIVTGVAQKPEHGIAGLIDEIEHDIENDPLGGILLLVVLIPLGPAGLAIGLGAIETVATVAVVAGVGQYTISGGKDTSILNGTAAAAKWGVTHPAEIGRVAAGTALAVAGTAVGAKGLAKLGTGLLASGVSNALGSDAGETGGGDDHRSGKKFWWQSFSKGG